MEDTIGPPAKRRYNGVSLMGLWWPLKWRFASGPMVAIEMAFDWLADGGPLLDVAKFSQIIIFMDVLERKVTLLIRLRRCSC